MKTNYYIYSLVLMVLAVVISPTTCYPQNPLPEHKERLPLVQGTNPLPEHKERLPLVQGAPELQDVSEMDSMWQVLQQQDRMEQDYGAEMEQNYYDTNMEQDTKFEQFPVEEIAKTEQASSQWWKCISEVYVMGFTGNKNNAGSDDLPYLILDLTNHERGHAPFPDNPGNDMVRNKGDLWRIPISAFRFKKACILKNNINKISVQEGGNDGWYVSSIFTAVASGSRYALLSADVDVDRWINGNGSYSERQLSLTIQK